MKNYFTIFALAFVALLFTSCRNDDNDNFVDNDTYSSVYDFKNVNFGYNSTDGWNYYKALPTSMYSSDVMLIYQQTGSTTDGSPIWQSIPAKYNPVIGGVTQEVYYDFDFSKYDFKIYVRGTFDLTSTIYTNNQTFRVVLVPAGYGGKAGKINIDDLRKLPYEDVIKQYNIDDTKVKTL